MSKIVYAWELGAGYGHIDAFLPVAKLLQARGHEIIWIVKDLQHVPELLGSEQFSYFQAPIQWPFAQSSSAAMNYAGVLRNSGFNDKNSLLARTQAWKTLFSVLNPDLILFDHAPTALLAAHSLKYPRATFGSGFCSPPKISPMPCIRPWLKTPEKDLLSTELEVITTANSVLTRTGGKPLNCLADLFDVAEDFLCTYQELDHYPSRDNGHYWGSCLNNADGIKPTWPSVGKKRIFAYLNKEYPGLESLLRHLGGSSWSIAVHIAGITPAFIQKFSTANLHISPQRINLQHVGELCDLTICHAGAGTTANMLLQGQPLLTIPMQVEQWLIGRNIQNLGAGLSIPADTKKPSFLATIKELLSNDRYRLAAKQFSEKYRPLDTLDQQRKIADRCEDLVRAARFKEPSKFAEGQ